MSRTRAVFSALSLILVLLVAGCSDDDPKPKFAPPSSEAPTSPSSSLSSTVDTAREEQAGLIEEFVGAISTSLTTGDSSAFLGLAASSCQNCRVLADNLESAYADGGNIEEGKWALVSSEYRGEKPLGAIWNVDIRSARERWLDGNGEVVKIVRAGTQRFGIALEESGDGWRVRELRLRG